MPKERLKHGPMYIDIEQSGTKDHPGAIERRQWSPGMDQPPGSVIKEEPSLDVSWNREAGWVQIAFDAPRDWWDGFYKSVVGSPEQHNMSAYTDVLTRTELNHMIRTLRRARDSAYGADE